MSNEFLNQYEYSDYLEAWENKFNDQEIGIESYSDHGKEIHCAIYKLSLEKFQDHIKKLKENWDAFDKAYDENDGERMDKSLRKAFPHELVLLC